MKLHRPEQGQTLVETMVAIFILVMGITAALGLAIYSFNATSLVNKQIVGMGLAREGIEAVKNMRDTNWLNGIFDSGTGSYLDWQQVYYNINPSSTGTYTLDFSAFASKYWSLSAETTNFRLSYDPTVANGSRMYYPATSGGTPGDYYRRITLTESTSSPYSATSPRLDVIADVWWNDRKCPTASTFEASKPACRIRLQTYLTNWKNY